MGLASIYSTNGIYFFRIFTLIELRNQLFFGDCPSLPLSISVHCSKWRRSSAIIQVKLPGRPILLGRSDSKSDLASHNHTGDHDHIF